MLTGVVGVPPPPPPGREETAAATVYKKLTLVNGGGECQTTLTKRPGRPVGMPHERRLQQICRTRYHLLNRVKSSDYSHGKPTDVDYFHFDSALRIRRRLSETAAIKIDTSRPTDSPLCDYPVLHGT